MNAPQDAKTFDQDAVAAYDGPPDYRVVGRHAMFPETTHDEAARFNFLAHLNRHLAGVVMPGVKTAYETRIAPEFEKRQDRPFKDRHEARKALAKDPYFQMWSALRRNTMEMRQQAGRWVTLRQSDTLNAKADDLVSDENLELNLDVETPRYLSAVDHHCMPGSYHGGAHHDDVVNAANYDVGIFATTGGALGRYSDGGGAAVAAWLAREMPDFKPKRILDLGTGLGHNILSVAEAFPDAEVFATDQAAPMLKYGAARAKTLGVDNVKFVQADVERLSQFEDDSFDLVLSVMFLHETSYKGMQAIFAETRRLLKPGGVVLHVEQPQYDADMPVFEQAMRDWDSFYNNEPFWTRMHEIDLDKWMVEAGFDKDALIHGGVTAVVDKDLFPDAADDNGQEDYGRKAAWHVVGARKEPA